MVVGVHWDDDVEVGEVVDVDLAGAVGEGEVALDGVVAHSGVGELACVVVAGGGGVDVPVGGVVVLVDDVEEGALGCGGAADVAEADEEDFEGAVGLLVVLGLAGGGGVLVHVGCVCFWVG